MKKQSPKHWLFALLLPLAAIGFSACTTNDEPEVPNQQESGIIGDEARGYFRSPMGTPAVRFIGADDCETEFPLSSSLTEQIIPIHMIADNLTMFKESGKWGDAILRPGNNYDISGNPEDYPNSLEVSYRFKWVELSTYKVPNSDEGILRIKADKNPYNTTRSVAIWLKNEKSSVAEIRQDANPEGIDPPEGDNMN